MASSTDWFLTRPIGCYQPARVFCFGHAGGNVRTWLNWQPALAGDAELVAVCPPGRGHRSHEAQPSLADYVDGAATAIAEAAGTDPRPGYLFGHSLGGLVAFEVARRLTGEARPAHLIISGLAAPARLPSARVLELSRLDGKEFAEALVFFGGMPPEVLAEQELRDLLLPGVQSDFRMAAEYQYRPGVPLSLPATLVNGRGDPHVQTEQLVGWQAEFEHEPAYRWAAGGHFYFESDPSSITEVLAEVVRADQHVELI